METNSPADTEQPLPVEDTPAEHSVEASDESAEVDPGTRQQTPEEEGGPEAVLEEPVSERVEKTADPDQALAVYNVTEETSSDASNEALGSPGASDRNEGSLTSGSADAETEALDPLQALAAQAQRARLSAPDEERATNLLKEALLDGRAGITRSVAILPNLPWVIGVSAVSAVWTELKTAFKTQLISGLGKSETDAARRMRLSLARGLFKVDVPTALKLAVTVAKEMRDKETGAISPKNAQIFANVLIGRAKPWVAQIPLNDLKPAEADLLVHCALLSAFSVPHAPVTQLGVLKWAAGAGRLVKLHELALASTTQALGRWSAKWQAALRKEVPDLPDAILEFLKAPAPEPGSSDQDAVSGRRERSQRGNRRPAGPEAPKIPEDRAPETEDEDERERSAAPSVDREEEDEDEEDDRADSAWKARLSAAGGGGGGGGREQGRPRPVYESKTVPKKPPQQQEPQQAPPQRPQREPVQGRNTSAGFDLRETLRQIESHVAGLRSELASTQTKLRQREQDTSKSRRTPERASVAAAPIIPGEPTPDELARLNVQLEGRNAELQQRIAELTQDSEDRAASMGRHGSEPVEQPDAQLRTLLSLKLQEDYEDFAALEKEKPDLVVQQHYRTLLSHVLDVLRQEGVDFQVRRGE